MKREEPILVEKLLNATREHFAQYRKCNLKALILNYHFLFSPNDSSEFVCAVEIKFKLNELKKERGDDAVLFFIYKQAFCGGGILHKNSELKNLLLGVCADYLGIQSLQMNDFSYALISRKTGRSPEVIKQSLINQSEKVSDFSAIVSRDVSFTSTELHATALSKWLESLYNPDKRLNQSISCRV